MRAAIWEGPGRMAIGTVPDATCPVDGVLLQRARVRHLRHRRALVLQRRPPDRAAVGARPRDQRRGARDRRGRAPSRGRRERHLGRRRGALHLDALVRALPDVPRRRTSTSACDGELMGFDYPGAYAEHVAIPQIALKNLFRIPDGLSPAHATFADPLSDVICGHKDIAIGLDDTVVVIGAGPVGTAHAALARLQGAGQVLLLERSAQPARARRGDPRPAIALSYVDTETVDMHRRGHARDGGLRRRRRDRRVLERHRPGGGDGDGRAARARAVLRRPAEGHDAHPVPLEHPALQGGAGARLVRLAPPRPGARRSTCSPRDVGGIRRVVSASSCRSTRRPTPSRGSARASVLKVVVAP